MPVKNRRKVPNKKVFEDEMLDSDNDSSYSPAKEKDAYKNIGDKKKRKSRKEKLHAGKNFDENDDMIMRRLQQEKKRKEMKKFMEENYVEKEKDLSKMTPL